jgi:hypothetical protein
MGCCARRRPIIVYGMGFFRRQVLFWCDIPQVDAAKEAPNLIYERIVGLEVSKVGADWWLSSIAD